MQDHIDAIARESQRVAELIAQADLERSVPACPDWNFRDLILHLGEVQRFWAECVRMADTSTHFPGTPPEPESDDALAAWFSEGSGQLVDALSGTTPDAPCWTWWGEPATAGAVARHQVQELVVHRWDAEAAVSTPRPIDSAIADDGVDEFVSIMMRQRNAELDRSVGLVSSDTNSIWLAGPPDAPQMATVTATASDLVLMLYNRVPISVAHVDGQAAAVHEMLKNPATH